MAKSKLVPFLVVGIVVLVLLLSGEVFAEQHDDTSAADDWFAKIMESYNEDGSSDPLQTVAEQGVVEGSGQLPFEEYNSPPDISGGQQAEQNKKQISHPICPGSVGNLALDPSNKPTNNFHHVECRYIETRYVAGHYQTYILASFSVAWAEDNSVSDDIKKQLCMPSYIGWEEWSDNGKAASITDVYLHDDEIALKDELKRAIKEGLGKAEARALPCGGEVDIDKERERVAKQYPGLKNGYLLYAEGKVSTVPLTWVLGESDYGHVGIYIGDYQVPEGKNFKVRDKDQLPLRVFRNGKSRYLRELGDDIIEGDWIIGAVVEMRWNGAVFTTVDGMKASAKGGYMQREPKFAWKTTKTPPNEAQVKEIIKFVLSKVELTENGELLYWPGKQGIRTTSTRNPNTPKELWDCVSLAEAAYESIGFNPTPEVLDFFVSIQPQEQYDNIDRDPFPVPQPTDVTAAGIRVGSVGIAAETLRDLVPFRPRIQIKVESPVNLHLYDSQGRHVGITPSGTFEREIPNAYYNLEFEKIPQSITVRDVDDEYTLITEAVGDGSFTMKILDLNVRTPGSLTKIEFQDVMITKGAIGKLNIGSADNDYLMDIDDDGDGDTDRTLEPSSLETSPTQTDASTPPCTGTSTYAYIESRTMEKGKEVTIPVMMCNANDLANMDFTFSYDPDVLRFKNAEKGSLNSKFLFESNEVSSGNIKIAFASSKGVSGSGSIAILIFDVIGSNGDSTVVTGTVNTADTSSGSPIGLTINPGGFTVGPSVPGDCDGDGLVTSKDALAALQMSVGKIKTDLCYDVTGDGKVSSDDARDILKKAVKL